MKRNKKDFIISADLHLTDVVPVCRRDMSRASWIELLERGVSFLYSEALKYKADVIISGDIFDGSTVPDYLITMLLGYIFRSGIDHDIHTYILPGNHDLPYHKFDNIDKSKFGILWKIALSDNPYLHALEELGAMFPYGTLPSEIDIERDVDCAGADFISPDIEMVFMHELTFHPDDLLPPSRQRIFTADELLNRLFPYARYVITGDNHHAFLYVEDDRAVINPGCLIRDSADLMDYTPGVFLLRMSEEGDNIDRICFDDGEISDRHLQEEHAREDRIDAFVSIVASKKAVSLDFIKNLRTRMDEKEKEIGQGVISIIDKLLEESHGREKV
jgi:hypothetical protein